VTDAPKSAPVPAWRAGLPFLVTSSVIVASLVVTALAFGLHNRARHRDTLPTPTAAQAAALAAARSEAVAMTTIGYQTAASDVNRILAGATGQLRTQFEKERADLPASLAQHKSNSRGNLLSAGLESLTPTNAKALVAVDATVTGSDTGPSGVVTYYRMLMTLENVSGRWLVSNVAFAGQ
jgi:Mce-associated membrane protein